MPPKKNRKSAGGTSTPKTSAPPQAQPEPMDVDTPQEAQTPVNRKPSPPPAGDIYDPWTDDETSSLYKAIIRWKPNGIHGHFRMIAISEHLRNHGFNPEQRPHTRVPGIWKKLETLYDMKLIDERENSFAFGDENDNAATLAAKYNDFLPPQNDPFICEKMWKCRLHSEDSASESEGELDLGNIPKSLKRKREEMEPSSATGNTAKTRASTVEDTEADTSMPSSPVTKSARGARSSKRAAAKAKASSTEPEPEPKAAEENDEDEADEDNSDGEDAETAASSTKKTRASARTAGTTRGRGRGGRKSGR